MKNKMAYSRKSLPRPYIGVCDVNPLEAALMADEFGVHRRNPERDLMIGVMTGPLALNPDLSTGNPEIDKAVREFYLPRDEIAKPFTEHPYAKNTIHYADLYGPNAGNNLHANLQKCVEHGGPNLHAIQLDVTLPDPNELKKFKESHPEIDLILQMGETAFAQVDTPEKLVKRLHEYDSAIDYVLLDLSMGKGKKMDPKYLLPFLRAVRTNFPYLGLAVAGGLGPETVGMLEPITEEFPDISIDAEGGLKHEGAPKDAKGHYIARHPAHLGRAKDYIAASCRVLDNIHKRRSH